MKLERGFTLIELLTVIGTLGVLLYLSINSYKLFRSSAGYGAAQMTMISGRNEVEAAVNKDPDNLPAAVPLTTQSAQGPLTNNVAHALLPNFILGKKVKFSVSYDPTCDNAGCQSEYVEASHCMGLEHIAWVRFGDGVGVVLEHLPGGGC
jgi:prepilin-type N-terminal cleavage/methylation domain-containing protein